MNGYRNRCFLNANSSDTSIGPPILSYKPQLFSLRNSRQVPGFHTGFVTSCDSRQHQFAPLLLIIRLSGVVKSGMFLAIMGASGAGKTTLLTAISQRRKGGVEGEIMVNGQRVSRDFMTQISGFVPQQDLFVDCLSVTEHLQFMVNLKVKPGRYTIKYFDLIEILLLETGLEKCRHTRICDISGGEKKRLSLAVQVNLKVKPGRYTIKYFDLIEILLLETGLEKCRHTRICDISGGEKKRLSLAVQVETRDLDAILLAGMEIHLRYETQHFTYIYAFYFVHGRYYKKYLVALLISLPYVDVKVDQKGIQSLQGLLYLIITETIFTFMYSVTNVFPQELPVLIREISSGLYHPAPYYAAKVFILLPRSVVGPTLFTGLVFWFARLDGGMPGFLVFCVPVILSATAATAYGK
ncbi:hypothetical protein C0J52_25425 [Blattella germanica]|nr:hypothetical protein C0J52_25425 [Blattella germanica]